MHIQTFSAVAHYSSIIPKTCLILIAINDNINHFKYDEYKQYYYHHYWAIFLIHISTSPEYCNLNLCWAITSIWLEALSISNRLHPAPNSLFRKRRGLTSDTHKTISKVKIISINYTACNNQADYNPCLSPVDIKSFFLIHHRKLYL